MMEKMKRAILALWIVSCMIGASWAAEREIVFDLGSEPQTIDPALSHALNSMNVVENIFEGLVRIGADSRPEAGCAESWEVSEAGLSWTFHLRDGLKWSDGRPLVAEDFRYGFLRALDPAVAAPYAELAFVIKGGEAFFKGEAKEEDVGFAVVDDRTLRLDLERSSPMLLHYLAFTLFRPARRDVVEADPRGWATKPETLVSNGPFKLDGWRRGEGGEIVLAKDPHWYGADGVKIDRVRLAFITDRNTALAAFKSGRLDWLDGLPPQMAPQLLASGEAVTLPSMGTEFCRFNTSRPPFDDARVRRAFSLAIDRKAIVEKLLQGGQRPAAGLVPYVVPGGGSGKDFRAEVGPLLPEEADVSEARRLMAEAGYPDGQGFPAVAYKYNSTSNNKILAEALQAMWKDVLGVEVGLLNEEWKVYVVSRREMDFDIARSSWVMDFLDAANILELFTSSSHQNYTGYGRAAYDDLITNASREMDPSARAALLRLAEQILIEDMPVAPIYFYAKAVMQSSRARGICMTLYDRVYFRDAEVVEGR